MSIVLWAWLFRKTFLKACRHISKALVSMLDDIAKRRVGEAASTRTVCGKWVCGSPNTPKRHANFYASCDTIALEAVSFTLSEFEPCGNCFDAELLKRYGWASRIPVKKRVGA